jgi:hypothetical protein
MKNFE